MKKKMNFRTIILKLKKDAIRKGLYSSFRFHSFRFHPFVLFKNNFQPNQSKHQLNLASK